MTGTLNPGSRAALDQGCTCPVLDNNSGASAPYPPNGWVLDLNCPVHWALAAQIARERDDGRTG